MARYNYVCVCACIYVKILYFDVDIGVVGTPLIEGRFFQSEKLTYANPAELVDWTLDH